MKLKRPISLLLTAAMLLSTVGCVELDKNRQPLPTPEVIQSALFETYLMDNVREVVGDNLFDCRFLVKNAASYGVTNVPVNIGRIDFDEYDNAKKYWQEDYNALTAFCYEELTEEQQFLYDLIKHDMELSKKIVDYKYLNELNSPLLGIQSQLPSLLPEFKLYTVQDAYDYITMIEHIPDYFGDMLELQRRKSQKGLFMSDTMADELIKSCNNFMENREENALITTFEKRISDLPGITKAETARLLELNRKAVLEDMIPAYEAFAKGIEELKGTGKNEGGICGYQGGKEYYEYLVQSGTGSDRNITEIAEMMDNKLDSLMTTISFIVTTDRSAIDRLQNAEVKYAPPEEFMQRLKKKTAKDFPPVNELKYEIKYIAPELEEHSSPAFFIVPQMDDPFNNQIYINRKSVGDDNIYLFTTLAHEGYPGHMYQRSYFNATKPHPVRSVLDCQGYSEGWASYVENLSYEMAGIGDIPLIALMQVDNMFSLIISSRADIGVNYEGWDKVKLKQYLANYGFDYDTTVESLYAAVIQDPANYLNYGVGMLEMQQLRRHAETELGDNFDAMGFHRAILDVGPAPFSFVRESVDAYISQVQTAEKTVSEVSKAA